MKKRIITLIAVVALVAVLGSMMAACNLLFKKSNNSNSQSGAKSGTGDGELVPTTLEEAKALLEEAGYTAAILPNTDAYASKVGGAESVLTAWLTEAGVGENLTMYYFDDSAKATAFYNEMMERLDFMKDSNPEEYENFKATNEYGHSGRFFYYGTKAIVQVLK